VVVVVLKYNNISWGTVVEIVVAFFVVLCFPFPHFLNKISYVKKVKQVKEIATF
jgi:hypothetical protein